MIFFENAKADSAYKLNDSLLIIVCFYFAAMFFSAPVPHTWHVQINSLPKKQTAFCYKSLVHCPIFTPNFFIKTSEYLIVVQLFPKKKKKAEPQFQNPFKSQIQHPSGIKVIVGMETNIWRSWFSPFLLIFWCLNKWPKKWQNDKWS